MDVIIIAALAVAVMVALARCGQAAEQSYCPICGQPLECNDKGWSQYNLNTAQHDTAITNNIYIMNCEYGKDFITLNIPRVCNECQKTSGRECEKTIQRQFDAYWAGTIAGSADRRHKVEEKRKEEQIRRLENEIKNLKEKP